MSMGFSSNDLSKLRGVIGRTSRRRCVRRSVGTNDPADDAVSVDEFSAESPTSGQAAARTEVVDSILAVTPA